MYLCSEIKVADHDHDADHDAAHHLYKLLLLQVMEQSLHYEINRYTEQKKKHNNRQPRIFFSSLMVKR